MTATIIECNRQLGQGNNASWTNTYQTPITVSRNAVISVKNTFLDLNANNSFNIELPEDVEIKLEFGYYMVNTFHPEGVRDYTGAEANDYATYVARLKREGDHAADDGKLITNAMSITLEKGNYTPAYLAETITRKLTSVKLKSTIPHTHEGIRLDNKFLMRSDANDLAGQDRNSGTKFVLQTEGNDGTHFFTFKKEYVWTDDPAIIKQPCVYFVGSNQVSLVFENNRFQFEYLHTPVIDSDGGNEVITFRQTDAYGSDYHICNRRSGVFFTKVEPKSFWEDILGFDVEEMTVSVDASGTLDKDLDEGLGKQTTGGFIGLTNVLLSKGDTMNANPAHVKDGMDGFNFTDTGGITTSIVSNKNYNPSLTSGYYLLSIKGLTNVFTTDNANRSDIMGIIPKQYSNHNTITSYENSSINWINRGETFLLSNLKVEILDPVTKDVIEGLGSNNCIYLELIDGAR